MSDPYATLGVARGASEDDINKAYKKLAMQYHPDRNPENKSECEKKMAEINAARDAILRGVPDQNPFQNAHGFNPHGGQSWTFNFGGGNGGFHGVNIDEIMAAMHAQQQRRNRDINVECQISLEDAFKGTEITVNLRGQKNEVRNVSVKIPSGIVNGNRIRVAQAGENNYQSMAPGDLFVIVHIQPHTRFQQQGRNLIASCDADVFDVLLGGRLKPFTGIDGTNLDIKIPDNYDPTTLLKLQGHGMPVDINSSDRGDLLINVRVKYPTLNDTQRQLIRQANELKL